jgi:hypothetical protein
MDNLELLQADLKHHIEFVKFIEGKCLAFLAAATALAAVSLGALANPEYSSFRLPILNVAFFALLAVVFLACAVLPIEVRPKRIGTSNRQRQNLSAQDQLSSRRLVLSCCFSCIAIRGRSGGLCHVARTGEVSRYGGGVRT